MFAPRIPEPQTKAAESSTSELTSYDSALVAHKPGHDLINNVLFLQRTVGNQATLRILARHGSSLTKREPGRQHKQDADPASRATTNVSRDFSRIPASPLDQPIPTRTLVPNPAPPPSTTRQRKFAIARVGDQSKSNLQRKSIDEESFAKLPGKIEEVGSTTGGGGGFGVEESNEFLLWNYKIGSPEPRAEHIKYLTDKVLASGRWPDMLRDDPQIKIGIVAGASATGDAAANTPLSVARADRIKAFLASGGINPGRIVSSGLGSRRPFADETSSENMARNRRVEVFLFRPTRRVASLPGVSVKTTSLSASVEVGFTRDPSDPNRLVLRWRPFVFNARVDAAGPPEMQVGIVQFLRSDSRVGSYESTDGTGNFLLDSGRCMQPDLPCKDVAESLAVFSGPGILTAPGSGEVSMRDSPGYVMPIQVSSPKSGNLRTAHWEMEFVAVLGARVGDAFLPVKSVTWRLEHDHARDASGALNPVKSTAKADAPQDGAPSDLGIEKAMAGRTCRFMARRMNDYCRPELVS